MKKHNLRGKFVAGAIVAFGIFFINNNAYADTTSGLGKSLKIIDPQKEYCTGITDSKTKENCQNAVKLCKNIITSEVDKYKIDTDLDIDNTFKYSVTGTTSVTKNMTATYEGNSIASGTKLPSDFSMITFTADLSATKSYVGDGGTPISCTGKFEWTKYYNNLSPVQSEFENPSCKSGGICRNYLDGGKIGTYKMDGVTYDLDKEYSYKTLNALGSLKSGDNFSSYLKKYLPYCDCDGVGKQISDIHDDEYIKSQIINVARSFQLNKDVENTKLKPGTLPPYTSIKANSTKQSFVCDAFSKSNTQTFYYKQPDPKIVKYNNTMTGESTEICRVECSEEVTVNYNPPVAVKGSICFEYEIDVKSKTTCAITNTNLKPPTPPVRKKTCQMQVRCNSHSGIISMQAGPNEDFDNCVSENFNGKYTQKAINYCYNKIYKKNKSKKVSNNYNDNIIPQKMANTSNNITIIINGKSKTIDYCSTDAMKEISKMTNYNEYVNALNKVAEKIYAVSTTTNNGNYILSKTINGYRYYDWSANANSCYWNRYADVYKRNIDVAKSLVYDDEMFSYKSALHSNANYIALRQSMYTKSGYSGNSSLASISYYTADKGFKVGHYTNNGTTCNDTCVMYTTDSDCTPPGKNDSDYDEEYKKYLVSLDNYQTALKQCNAKVDCNKETATYRMSVNPGTSSTDIKVCAAGDNNKVGKDCISWVQKNSKTHEVDKVEQQKPLKYAKGVCYNQSEKDYDYHNIISFPGTWQRNKDGSFRFTKPASNSGYTEIKKQYCVDPSIGNINADWWNWDQISKRDESAKSKVNYSKAKNTLGVEYNKYNGTYNIYGKMEKFGYFNWELDFSCFYAVNNESECQEGDPDCPKKTCKPGDKNCSTTNGLKNSDTRTISLDDPFPAVEDTASKVADDTVAKKMNNTTTEENASKLVSSSGGRNPGYNWSCDATNLSIKEYPIVPTALTTKIKSTGDKIFDDKDEMDYEIEITPEQIRKIREYNREKEKASDNEKGSGYFIFSGSYETNKNNKIRFYKSSFLRQNTAVKKEPRAQCNNLKADLCDNLETYINAEKACSTLLRERDKI